MVNFLQDSEYLIPYLQETTSMKYSDAQVITSLGSLQDKLKLLNLIENYLLILIVVLIGLGLITLAVGPRFQKYFRREQLGENLKSTIINGVDLDEIESVKDFQ